MDPTVEALLKGIDDKMKAVDTFSAKLEEIDGKLVAKVIPDPKLSEGDAKLAKGALEGVTDLKVWDVPIGQALIGGFSAVFVSELVDGFLVNQQAMTLGVVKLATAGILVKWGKRLLGETGSKAAALILAYDGMRQILPIDEWAGNLSGMIKSRTGGGLAGKAGMKGNVLNQANKVVNDYYAQAEGR